MTRKKTDINNTDDTKPSVVMLEEKEKVIEPEPAAVPVESTRMMIDGLRIWNKDYKLKPGETVSFHRSGVKVVTGGK